VYTITLFKKGAGMPTDFDSQEPHDDTLGIFHALALHMEDNRRIDTDDIEDARLFNGRRNDIITKMELVLDENFGGDAKSFRVRMLTVIAHAAFEGDNPVLAIEHWLDCEIKASNLLYK
jgi:hypothetical protein